MKLSISHNVHLVEPGDFEPADHWYPRALNSNIHPLVSTFLNLSHKQIAERYLRLNPKADLEAVMSILQYQPKYFRWSGTDMMHVTNNEGNRKLTSRTIPTLKPKSRSGSGNVHITISAQILPLVRY